ncbi:uncharacterized protein [Anoplolepis gracilipes]|uniref:uncharacterized protein n=1 Tax=Anoplolepis gracilipes TaxID=354296 RepID=UPI003BA0E9DC
MTRKSTINRTLKLMLTLCGIWPGTSCVIICRAYWIIALTTDNICHYRYLLMHLHTNDLFDLMDCFSSFLTQVKFMTKLIIFWLNERKFAEVLTIMAEDWNDCCNSDINMRETTCKAKLASRITNAMFTLHTLTIVGYSIGIFLADVDVTDHQSELPLLLKVTLPVDIKTKRRYKMLLSAQFIHLILSGCGTGLLNALLLTLILHIGGQMDILCCWLKELVIKENEEGGSVVTTKIIRKHQKIINFAEYIENMYTYIALLQFTLNTVLICSLGFLIVTAIGSPDATEQIVRTLLFYTVTNLEAFIFCFAGEYLKNKSKAIGNAAYYSAWYEMKSKNSRNLIFIILRAQKQLTLTVGKIMDLSLESFTDIMKASGSYLSVLLAIMARKSTFNRTLKFMLTLCGVWPGVPGIVFCRICWIITVTFILFCHYRYFLMHVRSAEFLDLMDCMSSFLAYSKVIIKCAVFWFNERKFIEILAMIKEDWNDCVDSDVSMRETERKAKLSDRITNTIVTLHTTTIVAYCIGIILADADVTDHTIEVPFLNKVEIPFNINTQRMYRFVLITEFVLMLFYGWAAGITNSLLLTLTLHTAGQIDIIRCWLMQLVPYKEKSKQVSYHIITNKIIQKHQKIISFSENIEYLYTYIALLQFVSNTIMICSLAFVIVTAIGSPNALEQILKSLLFYVITNLEAFIFCFAGEYLSSKSKEIGIAAYNSAWYDLKSKDSRVLLFIILRSQKQLTLTVGKMMDLSLESFTSIMNASGSYLSVFRSVLTQIANNTLCCYQKTFSRHSFFLFARECCYIFLYALRIEASNRKNYKMTRESTISRIMIFMLSICGIWPGNSIILISRVFWVVTLAFIGFCHYLYFSTHLNSDNFFNLVDCLCSFLAHVNVVTKLVAFWINQRKLVETLALITDDWNDCANSDIEVRVTMRKAKLSHRITNSILILYTLSIVTYCLGVIIADADVTDETIEVPFVNKLTPPFSINTQRMYRCVLIAEFIHLILCNWTAGIVNAILLTLVLHVGGQVEILESWLLQFIPREIENKEESVTTNKIIQKHNKIIQFSKNIETLYTHIALLLFASNTLLICSIGFLIVTAIGTPDAMEQIIKCILFFSITNLEAFIFCYAGEYLSNKSKDIGSATYNCLWYNLRPKDIRVLLFIILRSQKQLTLTAGNMMDLSLESFTRVRLHMKLIIVINDSTAHVYHECFRILLVSVAGDAMSIVFSRALNQ